MLHRNWLIRARHIVVAAFVICVLLSPTRKSVAEQPVGSVEQLIGVVSLERDGQRQRLTAGDSIVVSDTIVTGDGAKVHIAFKDGSSVVAGPDTRFAVSEYHTGADRRGLLTLVTGIIRTGVSALWGSGFAVETHAAVASVRSTHWVTIANTERASVFVVNGSVTVEATATGDAVILEKGDGIDVPVDGGLGPIKQWPMERVGRTLGPTLLP